MKERPILFSAPMVRALLDGSKTQTRRVCKLPPAPAHLGQWEPFTFGGEGCRDSQGRPISGQMTIAHSRTGAIIGCPYGIPGDRLYVRETHAKIIGQSGCWIETDYRATYTHGDRLGDKLGIKKKWTPAIHMPRDASRIDLEITGVRVERLQDISEGDAIAEGWPKQLDPGAHTGGNGGPFDWYRLLWEQINGAGSWAANPWVWIVEFKRTEA